MWVRRRPRPRNSEPPFVPPLAPHPRQRTRGGRSADLCAKSPSSQGLGAGTPGLPCWGGAGRGGVAAPPRLGRRGGTGQRGCGPRRWYIPEHPAAAGRGRWTPLHAEVTARAARRQLSLVGAEFAGRLHIGGRGSATQAGGRGSSN